MALTVSDKNVANATIGMRSVLAITTTLLLTACATGYRADDGVLGGFSESQLAENVWRVSFRANSSTRSERAQDFALIRSADLALLNGYTHFGLLDANTTSKTMGMTTPSTSFTTGSISSTGNIATFNAMTQTHGGDTMYISMPRSTNTVVMFKGKPDVQGTVYDAKFVCTTLARKYEVTCQATKD